MFVTSVHCLNVVGLCTLQIMFDFMAFIDCGLFIVYLYDTCLIQPEKSALNLINFIK